jgi:hypothetical protein
LIKIDKYHFDAERQFFILLSSWKNFVIGS